MTTNLPDHVRDAVLKAFASTHTTVDGLAVDSFTILDEPGNYRVRLTYQWGGRTHTPEYRYIPPAEGTDYPLTRQIAKYHGNEECWGAFCADCGW